MKLIEPGPVDTEIWDQPGSEEPLYQGPKVPADEVADGIIAALGSDRFEHYLPDMKAVVDAKNADLDAYIAGAAADGTAMKALVFGVPPEPFGWTRRRTDSQPGCAAASGGSSTAAR